MVIHDTSIGHVKNVEGASAYVRAAATTVVARASERAHALARCEAAAIGRS